MKRCSTCGAVKPVSAFHRKAASRDGLSHTCAECAKERARRWRQDNPERFTAAVRDWQSKNREHSKEWRRTYRLRHAEYQSQKNAEYWLLNRERLSAGNRRWRKENRDHLRSMKMLDKARRKGAKTEFVDRGEVFRRYSGLCGICGEGVDPDDFHVDHIVPIIHGGEHSYANTQLAHPSCNLRKGSRLPETQAV